MVLSKTTLYRPLMPEQMIVFHQPSWIIQAASSQPHPQHWGLFWGIRVIKGNNRDESHLWAGCTHYSSEETLSWSKSDSVLRFLPPPAFLSLFCCFWRCHSFWVSLIKLRNVINTLGQVEGKWWEEFSTSELLSFFSLFLFLNSFISPVLMPLACWLSASTWMNMFTGRNILEFGEW